MGIKEGFGGIKDKMDDALEKTDIDDKIKEKFDDIKDKFKKDDKEEK